MGQLLSLVHALLDIPLSVYFFLRTGIRRAVVRRICRDLSNRYLTPTAPGKIQCDLGDVEIVTSSPRMQISIDGTYYFDRKDLRVKVMRADKEESIPLWDPRIAKVLQLFKYFRDNGINIPRNNEGVTYVPMPGEEEFNAGRA